MDEKLWKDCSNEEKAEFYFIQAKRYESLAKFEKGEITKQQFKYRTTKLQKRLDDLEKKFNVESVEVEERNEVNENND